VWRWPSQFLIEVEAYPACLPAASVPKLTLHATPGRSVTPEKALWYTMRLPKCRALDVGFGVHDIREDNPTLIGLELSA